MQVYLLLLHELRVRAVVDDVLAKDGGGEDGVDVLCADVLGLAVQNEVVARAADIDGSLLAQEDEGEDVAVLGAILLEESRGVHAVGDGAPHDGEPGEDQWGLIGVLEEELVRNVDEDGENNKGSGKSTDLRRHVQL